MVTRSGLVFSCSHGCPPEVSDGANGEGPDLLAQVALDGGRPTALDEAIEQAMCVHLLGQPSELVLDFGGFEHVW